MISPVITKMDTLFKRDIYLTKRDYIHFDLKSFITISIIKPRQILKPNKIIRNGPIDI